MSKVKSSFNKNAEGWSVGPNTLGNRYQPTGGVGTGYLAFRERVTEDGQGAVYNAPGKYLGDKSGYYGGTLDFDTFSTGNADGAPASIVLVGNGHVLFSESDDAPGKTWTHEHFDLLEANFLEFDPNDPNNPHPVSQQTMMTTLATLRALQIVAEYDVDAGREKGGLDNVVLATAPKPLAASLFEHASLSDQGGGHHAPLADALSGHALHVHLV